MCSEEVVVASADGIENTDNMLIMNNALMHITSGLENFLIRNECRVFPKKFVFKFFLSS